MSNPTLDQLRSVVSGYQETCVLAAAAELDIFTEIIEQGNCLSAEKLAERLYFDLRGISVLLDALAASGYLIKTVREDGAFYMVEERYLELLDSRHEATFIPMIRHTACIQRSWTQLAWSVKEGKPPVRPASILGEDQDKVSFIWAMNSIARTLVGPTIESLRQAGVLAFPRSDVRFLDVGGASGTYTQAFLEALPESQGTLFDLPVGVEAARKRFIGSAWESRVTLIEGDFYADPLPEPFDFVWISAIIHQHGIEESRELFEKAFRSLSSGGKVAVRDFMMNSDRTQPQAGAYFGINMLVATRTGRVYTYDEVKATLESVGFVDVELAVPSESMSAIVVGRKP